MTKPVILSASPRLCVSLITMLLLCTGCTTLRLNNADRLAARPDFTAAAKAAPLWCDDALKTINRLEHDLETQ